MSEIKITDGKAITEDAMKLAHELTKHDWINFDDVLDVLMALDRLGYNIVKRQN
jgi:hypothetical protein